MSRPVISTLPSCMSLGWTNLMSSSMSSSFRSAAQTRPSKSLRVNSLYLSGIVFLDRVTGSRRPIGEGVQGLESEKIPAMGGKLDTAATFERIFGLYAQQF